jgi:PAS domain S-box-containing protein
MTAGTPITPPSGGPENGPAGAPNASAAGATEGHRSGFGSATKPLLILHLEARREVSEQLRDLLNGHHVACELVRVDNPADYLTALKECPFDCVLANHPGAAVDGFSALKSARQASPGLPFVFLCEPSSAEARASLIKEGASDVVFKTELDRLPAAVRGAVEQRSGRLGQELAGTLTGLSDDRFRPLAEKLGQAFWMADAGEGKLLFVSPAFEKLWGRPASELIAQPDLFFQTIHAADRERVRDLIRHKAPRQEFQCEHRLARPDGATRWVWNRGLPLSGAEGRAEFIVGLAEDISDRKVMEERLQRSLDHHSAILRAFPDVYYLLEADGTIVDYHAAEADDLFLAPEEFVGRQMQAVLPEPINAQFADALDRVQKTRAMVTIEYALKVQRGLQHFEARLLPLLEHQVFVFVRNITERKRTEEAMRESQRRMSNLIDALPGIVFSCANDAQRSMTYLSGGVLELTGYKREELMRNSVISFGSIINPDDHARSRATIDAAIHARQPYLVEYRIRTRGGQERWLWEKGRGVFDLQGELIGCEGFITDITERKRAETALHEQSHLLRAAAEATNRLLTDTDYSSAIRSALQTLGQATGVDRVYIFERQKSASAPEPVLHIRWEWTRESVMPLISKSHMQGRTYAGVGLQRWQEAFDRGQVISGAVKNFPESERELLLRDDTASVLLLPIIVDNELWGHCGFDDCLVERHWSPAEESILTSAIASVGGLLKRKRAEEALKEAEQKYRGIFENAVEGIFQTSPEGRYLSANPALARMYGYASPEELIASVTNIEQQLYVEPELHATFRKVMESEGEVRGLEYQVYRKDGQTIWISETARAVRDAGGRLLYFEGIIEDISERKASEDKLRESNRRLEAALDQLKRTQQQIVQQERLHALGQMASGIAHDFNNALMAILGFSELLLTSPKTLEDREKVLHYLRTMNTAAKDASNVVKRLSEFYRNRDHGEVFPPVNVNKLVEQVVTLTQPKWKDQAQAAGVTIEVKTELAQVPMILGHDAELRECLTNLIFNAVDAMPNGGTLTLRTYLEDDQTVIAVTDTGTGMTDEVKKRCLEPFFSTKGQRGTGLGLAMVFGTLQRHQGTIDIQSEVGKGTTFLLKLPAQKQVEKPVVAAAEEGSTTLARSLNILVVDDEPLVRQVLFAYLTGDGHRVETANDGREALTKFGRGDFDLVLTDKSMPQMTGDALAVAIKQVAPKKPVVLVTGFGEIMKASGQKPEGIDRILCKPVTRDSLRQTVAEVMAIAA